MSIYRGGRGGRGGSGEGIKATRKSIVTADTTSLEFNEYDYCTLLKDNNFLPDEGAQSFEAAVSFTTRLNPNDKQQAGGVLANVMKYRVRPKLTFTAADFKLKLFEAILYHVPFVAIVSGPNCSEPLEILYEWVTELFDDGAEPLNSSISFVRDTLATQELLYISLPAVRLINAGLEVITRPAGINSAIKPFWDARQVSTAPVQYMNSLNMLLLAEIFAALRSRPEKDEKRYELRLKPFVTRMKERVHCATLDFLFPEGCDLAKLIGICDRILFSVVATNSGRNMANNYLSDVLLLLAEILISWTKAQPLHPKYVPLGSEKAEMAGMGFFTSKSSIYCGSAEEQAESRAIAAFDGITTLFQNHYLLQVLEQMIVNGVPISSLTKLAFDHVCTATLSPAKTMEFDKLRKTNFELAKIAMKLSGECQGKMESAFFESMVNRLFSFLAQGDKRREVWLLLERLSNDVGDFSEAAQSEFHKAIVRVVLERGLQTTQKMILTGYVAAAHGSLFENVGISFSFLSSLNGSIWTMAGSSLLPPRDGIADMRTILFNNNQQRTNGLLHDYGRMFFFNFYSANRDPVYIRKFVVFLDSLAPLENLTFQNKERAMQDHFAPVVTFMSGVSSEAMRMFGDYPNTHDRSVSAFEQAVVAIFTNIAESNQFQHATEGDCRNLVSSLRKMVSTTPHISQFMRVLFGSSIPQSRSLLFRSQSTRSLLEVEGQRIATGMPYTLYDAFAEAYGGALVDIIANCKVPIEAIQDVASRCTMIVQKAASRTSAPEPTCIFTRAFVLAGLEKSVAHLVAFPFKPTAAIPTFISAVASLEHREPAIKNAFCSSDDAEPPTLLCTVKQLLNDVICDEVSHKHVRWVVDKVFVGERRKADDLLLPFYELIKVLAAEPFSLYECREFLGEVAERSNERWRDSFPLKMREMFLGFVDCAAENAKLKQLIVFLTAHDLIEVEARDGGCNFGSGGGGFGGGLASSAELFAILNEPLRKKTSRVLRSLKKRCEERMNLQPLHSEMLKSLALNSEIGGRFLRAFAEEIANMAEAGTTKRYSKERLEGVVTATILSLRAVDEEQRQQIVNVPMMESISRVALTLDSRLGMGAASIVYSGSWRTTPVAIKVVRVFDERMEKVLRAELAVLAGLRHPRVLMLLAFCNDMQETTAPSTGVGGSEIGLVVELMERGSLFAMLRQAGLILSLSEALRIAADVCDGMRFLHASHLIHRDLKSGNVLVQADGRAKVSDFGLSGFRDASSLQMSGITGTPAWTAPEALREERVCSSCDVYSFGVILWELLTKKVPWDGVSAFQIIRRVSTNDERLAIPPACAACPEMLCEMTHKCFLPACDRPSFDQLYGELAAAMAGANRTCLVCSDEFSHGQGLACSGSDNHFLCDACFSASVQSQCSLDSLGQFRYNGSRLVCQFCQQPKEALTIFDERDVAMHASKEVYDLYTVFSFKARSGKLLEEAERQAEKRLQEELRKDASERDQRCFLNHIIETILTDKCPTCSSALDLDGFDFNMCTALKCDSCPNGSACCGWCFENCGDDAHAHVKVCPQNPMPENNFFTTKEQYFQVQRELKGLRIEAFVTQHVPVDLQATIRREAAVLLARLGS